MLHLLQVRVYNYSAGGIQASPRITEEMMAAVTKADSACDSREDILDPQGWVLLNYLMDSRTGLGCFRTSASGCQRRATSPQTCPTCRVFLVFDHHESENHPQRGPPRHQPHH